MEGVPLRLQDKIIAGWHDQYGVMDSDIHSFIFTIENYFCSANLVTADECVSW